jgi:ethanolamine ammonia-lyase small subunit
MTKPSPPAIAASRDLRHLTPARVALARSGSSLTTPELLRFALDHARARDAVHTPFESGAIADELSAAGLTVVQVTSAASDRQTYLKRPDLGRVLNPQSRQELAAMASSPCDVAIIIADGLSAAAVHHHAVAMVRELLPRLTEMHLKIAPMTIASGGRVALGDEIGLLLQARMVVLLIGERPGLSTPDSLGCYITYNPRTGLMDADRNCVSNIHAAGLSYGDATRKIAWLVREGLSRRMTGVALKDASAEPARLAEP